MCNHFLRNKQVLWAFWMIFRFDIPFMGDITSYASKCVIRGDLQHLESIGVITLVFYLCLPDPRASTQHMNSNKCGMSHWELMKAGIKTNCSIDNGVTVPPCTGHCPVHVTHTYWYNPQTTLWSRSQYSAYSVQSFNMGYRGNA